MERELKYQDDLMPVSQQVESLSNYGRPCRPATHTPSASVAKPATATHLQTGRAPTAPISRSAGVGGTVEVGFVGASWCGRPGSVAVRPHGATDNRCAWSEMGWSESAAATIRGKLE